MSEGRRQFWCDVGGTFTDCLSRLPNGTIQAHKLLSSGCYRGIVGRGSSADRILAAARADEPADFFVGWRLTVWRRGERIGSALVTKSADGRFELGEPIADIRTDDEYEIGCGLEAPLVGVRWLLGRRLHEPIGPVDIRIGTTRGTNALLERRGARTAFVSTAGFADILSIGDQARPRLFDLNIRKAAPLYERVIELRERIDAGGQVLLPLNAAEAREQLAALRDQGVESIAIGLVNSYANPAHEEAVEALARAAGFRHISRSARGGAMPRLVPRAESTVIRAFLEPCIRDYFGALERGAPEARIDAMGSAGGLIRAAIFDPLQSVLSGPAGGVIGAAAVARSAGFARAIGFDMGGTSTDVCRVDGKLEKRYEFEIADRLTGGPLRIVAPTLTIETVAAGGGSICGFDGVRPTVGPGSAGADPGPACYGRGGPLCITDVNLLLGRIAAEQFQIPLRIDAAARRLDELIERIERDTGRRYAREELALGFIDIANAHMAGAIRKASTERGFDVREHALVAFGGAGGQHACAVARILGMRHIVLHPLAGFLSALGIGHAERTVHATQRIGRDLAEMGDAGVSRGLEELGIAIRRELASETGDEQQVVVAGQVEMRYAGQDATISIVAAAGADYRAQFERRHRELFGLTFETRAVEIVALRAEIATLSPSRPESMRVAAYLPLPFTEQSAYVAGCIQSVPRYHRATLRSGAAITGPAIVAENGSTVWIEPGWHGDVRSDGVLVLEYRASDEINPATAAARAFEQANPSGPVDPITLELYYRRFATIAEQMGALLRRTALSTNVKERLDFSCAVFDSAGLLVAHAPHIPVHLGAMGHCVRCLLEDASRTALGPIRRGDIFITNDPFRGGSHLPDVTVITPVFADVVDGLMFFVASRAHHAEIGGISPGSMPPLSRNLAEEGVLIRTQRMPRDPAGIARLFSSGPLPSRSVDQNVADVCAQVAANQRGAELLRELAASHGVAEVAAYMRYLHDATAIKTGMALQRFPDGKYAHADILESDGAAPIHLRVTIRKQGSRAWFDFTGSSPACDRNLNATPAIVASAVIYCLRCLINEDVPLNAGILAPIEIIIPPGSLLDPIVPDDPAACPAVVGGNVETSQRIVDCILGALRVAAASQGTMNNLSFGAKSWGYYETICGGAGAGRDFDGASAVHTHMTNTRLTDVEILEARYPVRLRRFAIRSGSGGAGNKRGGDGVIREFEFLTPLEAAILSQRRESQPVGLNGGAPGNAGRNTLIRQSGEETNLGPAARIDVTAGDVLRIETPGGGGFGSAGGSIATPGN